MTSWQTKEAGASNALLGQLGAFYARRGHRYLASVISDHWRHNANMIERHNPPRPARKRARASYPRAPRPPKVECLVKVQPPLKLGQDMIAVVAQAFNMTPDDITGRNQHERYIIARQAAYYVVKRRFGYSYGPMRSLFKRDHSTIIKGIHSLERRMRETPSLKAKIESLLK